MGTQKRTAVIFADLHYPYHERQIWRLMRYVCRDLRPDMLFCAGDMLDMACVSKHPKPGDKTLALVDEMAGFREEIESVGKFVKRKIWVFGNHEARLWKMISRQAPALQGAIDLFALSGLAEDGWEHVEYNEPFEVHGLKVCHDLGWSGKYAGNNMLSVGPAIVGGHNHRLGAWFATSSDGAVHQAATCGWLGDPRQHKDYKHPWRAQIDWAHGFVIARWDGPSIRLEAVPIHYDDDASFCKYRCLVSNKTISCS